MSANTLIPSEIVDTMRSGLEPAWLLLDEAFMPKVLEFLKDAKKRVWICAYTWRWYAHAPEKNIQKFNNLMVRLSSSGLDIRAIVDNAEQAKSLAALGISTKYLPTKKVLHTKAILIDDKTLILGSHNLTERGTAENFEASIALQNPDICLEFEYYFERFWNNFAVK